MQQNRPRQIAPSFTRPACLLACSLLCMPALAQTLPDAGSLLQQNQPRTQPPLPPKSSATLAPTAQPLALPAGATVLVKQFELQGNRLIDSATLQAALSPYLGRRLGLNDLQQLSAELAARYAEAGWLARCFLPPQDISDGVVRLQIVEARFDGPRIETAAARFDSARAEAMVLAQQPAGKPLNLAAMDRALMLLNDLPGLSASGALVAGRQDGDTALALKLADLPLFGGELSADNAGARSTGAARLNAGLSLNGALGLGDSLQANLSHTEGSNYLRLAAGAPLGAHGWRGAVNASTMQYKLIGSDFAALQAKGHSSTFGLDAAFAPLRSRNANLQVLWSLERKQFNNEANGASSSRYHSTLGSVGVSGNLFDELGGGGANSAGLTLSEGVLDLAGSANFAADQAGPRSHGGFTKLRYSASRQQTITSNLAAYLVLAGQWADTNLDSSEKFYLGGAQGVRAYPVSEAGGSQAQLLNLELLARLPAGLRATAFYDWGRVTVNTRTGFAGAAKLNAYALKGAGLSLAWSGPRNLDLRATLARRIGTNPNANASGLDQDGSLTRNRVWLQARLPI